MYNICFDNTARQYVVLSDHIIDGALQYLNITPILDADTEDEAYTKLVSLKRNSRVNDDNDIIQIYMSNKNAIKETYDRELWENDRYIAFLIQEDLAPRINKGFEEAFGTPLAASNYMRRLMWYMIDPFTHNDTEKNGIKGMRESLISLMTNSNLEIRKILFNFTEFVKLITLNEKEESRIQMLRDLVNSNK